MSRLSQKCFQLAGKSINAYVTACYRKRLSEIIVPPICYKCCLYCPSPPEAELKARKYNLGRKYQNEPLLADNGNQLSPNLQKKTFSYHSQYNLLFHLANGTQLLVTDKAKEGKMMEKGIGGTDALDWDIFLRGHGRRQMSKSEEVAAKINCSCDSQNTTRPAETKSKDFPFCRYFRKKAL